MVSKQEMAEEETGRIFSIQKTRNLSDTCTLTFQLTKPPPRLSEAGSAACSLGVAFASA
jgi:hypothetical protein